MDSLKRLHFYRKTPADLTESTTSGGAISFVALVLMIYLFVSQLFLFFEINTKTDIVMDASTGTMATMGIDFDITLARIPCEYASVDIFDVLGTARINVTEGKHNFGVMKTRVVTNSEDMKHVPGAKLKANHLPNPRDIKKEHHTAAQAIKAMAKFPVSEHKDWQNDWNKEVYSKEMDADNFESHVSKYDFAMVDFFAPWCHWCTELHPVWEHAAGLVEKTTMDFGEDPNEGWNGYENRAKGMYAWEEYNSEHPHAPKTLVEFINEHRSELGMGDMPDRGRRKVLLGKVDCTVDINRELCMQHRIMGYPTVRIYRDGATHSFEEYQGDRTAQAFLQYVHENVPEIPMTDEDETELRKAREQQKEFHDQIDDFTHEGCNLVGTIEVNKVPGKMVLAAHSNYHNFDVKTVNTSHVVHHLAFRSTIDHTLPGGDHHGRAAMHMLRTRLSRRAMREKKEELQKRLSKHKSTVPHFLHPMDNKRYSSKDPHTIQEHYIKVVHTKMNLLGWTSFDVYQMQVHSNTLKDEEGIPTTKISFDISPLNVVVEETRRSAAEFLTSLCAIIGGVFTVLGLFDSVVYHGVKVVQKMELGKMS